MSIPNNVTSQEVGGFKVYEYGYSLDNSAQKDRFKTIIKDNIMSVYNKPETPDPVKEFESLLVKNNIDYTENITIGEDTFNFKIGENTLISIISYMEYNTVWSPIFENGASNTQHSDKSKRAEKEGYHVIHVFDWDNKENIVKSLLSSRNKIYARNTEVSGISRPEMVDFLKEYHLQGTCNGQSIYIGLRDKFGELVSLMTFGKPRYNKNYQYELIRYCSSRNVIGGSEKIFKHFIQEYDPESIISYCDMGKFSGDVYIKLGFNLKSSNNPSKHWYCPTIEKRNHITDNFLRQRGYDQLFNEHYGRGTSNEELMIAKGYFPVCDAGQNTYEWHKPKN